MCQFSSQPPPKENYLTTSTKQVVAPALHSPPDATPSGGSTYLNVLATRLARTEIAPRNISTNEVQHDGSHSVSLFLPCRSVCPFLAVTGGCTMLHHKAVPFSPLPCATIAFRAISPVPVHLL